MLTIEIELLTGRYAATSHSDRYRAEWPPHPARFFSALVAALHEVDPPNTYEREALQWLERQPPPALAVDVGVTEIVGRRRVLDIFVPVNDITLIGDPEKPVREARETLTVLTARSAPDKDLRKARKRIETEEKKFRKFLDEQESIDSAPSTVSLDAAAALLPTQRTRQVRTLPVVVPFERFFAFIWAEDAPPELGAALDRLCRRVTRLGHSSSLVRCAVTEQRIEATLVPDEEAPNTQANPVLRVAGPGQLDQLEVEFQRHQGVESRVLPYYPQRYRPVQAAPDAHKFPQSLFSDDWIIFERTGGSRPLSSLGPDLARALRDALIEQHGSTTLSESLSGHSDDGRPTIKPHVAFVALPFVGYEHADASIQGIAIVPPRGLSPADRQSLLRLIAAWEKRAAAADGRTVKLSRGTLPPAQMQRVEIASKVSVNPTVWCAPARRFVTATPIALDKNPGNLRSNQNATARKATIEAQLSIADGCVHIGLPYPCRVEVSLAPLLRGTQPVRDFRPWPGQPGRTPRVRVHAEIEFREEVAGPVIIGAGRYFGLGLLFPISRG